jgi:ABC-type Mn2+/Zn2+ transport system ATPase subunit
MGDDTDRLQRPTLLGADVVLVADRVSVDYGSDPVLVDVDLVVERGDLTGIVGPSGSGKSTLLRTLLGEARPSTGAVHRRTGLTVGFVPQVERIDWNFPVTVAECVGMANARGWRTPWLGKAERRLIQDVLDRLGLGGLERRHIRNLSGGQQQRVFIARALYTGADVMLLDEPTSGLDVRTRHEVLHLLEELNREGLTILLTTHDLNGMAAHLPKIVCLNRSILGEGRPEDVLVPSVLERTYGSPMDVLEHGGMRVVVDAPQDARVLPFRSGRGA